MSVKLETVEKALSPKALTTRVGEHPHSFLKEPDFQEKVDAKRLFTIYSGHFTVDLSEVDPLYRGADIPRMMIYQVIPALEKMGYKERASVTPDTVERMQRTAARGEKIEPVYFYLLTDEESGIVLMLDGVTAPTDSSVSFGVTALLNPRDLLLCILVARNNQPL